MNLSLVLHDRSGGLYRQQWIQKCCWWMAIWRSRNANM